ncbi:hypothetical protein EX30DRAFT_360563 [Ascodesmis nigricans]|uniref:Senescence domain-containing protein n=1 Tax=Ascodesmis nigricans TaxID=341454 RepID=A0A4S2N5V0_9PEZI|nr:hypothetical protein EX30DRAFT_360563 [Ascodesmis nigricans]
MAVPLLTIPSATLTQVIPSSSQRVPLHSGLLTVSTPLPSTGNDTKLLLELAGFILPLTTSTQVRAHAKDEGRYLITLPLPPVSSSPPTTDTDDTGDTGMVELTLPAFLDPSSSLRFEQLLVTYNFLTTGLAADADDVVSSLQSAAASVVDAVGGYARGRVQRRERVEAAEEVRYSDVTHDVVDAVAERSGGAKKATERAAGAVEGAGRKAGGWVGENVGAGEGVRGVVEAVETLGGVGEAVRAVAGTVGEAGAAVVENEKGAEARGVFDGVRKTTGNVAGVVGDVMAGTSVVWQAGVAATGVGKEGEDRGGGEKPKTSEVL